VKIHQIAAGISLAAAGFAASAQSGPVMMSPEWAAEACKAWTANPILTEELVKSGWIANDGGRGFKVMHIFRTDCADPKKLDEYAKKIELKIANKDGKAACVYGGAPQEKVTGNDYVMHANTDRWVQMGKGEYGPMKAMMLGRLMFDGPMWEAMKNMGPFEQFLLIPGKVPGDTSKCP
jgi:putative sterol carrier protein